jgi:ABC-type branched-subunit amino acid transport system substrate-binding protein
MMLLAQAMKAADATEGKKLQAELTKIKYKGIAGNYEFDHQHNLKESPVTIFHFQSGLPVPISSY